MDDVIDHYEWKCQSAWQLHQVFEVCDTIVISWFNIDLILCYNIGMESQICKTIDIFGSEIYMFVVVLACFASCANFNIIRLHQECCPYMLSLINWWNHVSSFWHDIDNEITNSIHIIRRSRHNHWSGHSTMLIDESPLKFQMVYSINMDDVIYHYEWKCQSAWQFHQVLEVCDKIVISYT